jgi:hypothetical protein
MSLCHHDGQRKSHGVNFDTRQTVMNADNHSAYHPPAAYNGTTTTVLKTSTVNATHWKADIVCTGCSAWFGGAASIPALGSTVFGYGVSNHSLGNPALLSTSIPYHNVAKGHWELNITAARNSASDFTKLTTPA